MIRNAQHGFSQLSLNETSSRENRGEDVSGFIVFSTCSDGINNVRNAHTDCCIDVL